MNFLASLQLWLSTNGFRVVIILAGAYLIDRAVKLFISRIIRKLVKPNFYASKQAEQKREDTLIRVLSGTFSVALWLMAFLLLLSEFGLNIGPLLAGAGIAGLAFGFGAQYLIRDIITGLFIILENQFRVGDVICIDGTCGAVEDVNLRITTLRDLDGVVHHIPNGEIKKTSNLSKDFARVNLNVGVGYGSDLDHVIQVVNRVGNTLALDPAFRESIKKAPQFLRVNDFGESSIQIKILGDVAPLKQWEVTGELRKRLKIAFDKEGIEMPLPQRVVYMKGRE
ncbi:mechanosensitive ion channel family protein [Patescibacteria group bacterium]|uniref:Mechanosensitive ion channel family protein n=1 Tax=candidate division WWE3 bacterium TaxID=2053526 RepID=A0A928TUT3_UNCKA|nr:mechanosensitive ion channel family protein [candidate division WWE3 bacterium]MCL4732535.1 mechanosensitive ion channel family protein [Patescibacteria group bacterium]MDL1953428.1 mechanosensitive ion channel family protein [Candidatus Uhrbacteria bacterium UHB]RIL00099.1 MAG: mechanosensitive ion channel family protein [Candidatus Uhrbacteria bacterium]